MNSTERRNKHFIKPFWIFPDSSILNYEREAQTRNQVNINEFSLPCIFSKDVAQPSTNESDRYVKADQWLQQSSFSDEIEDPTQSSFLLKLENSLPKQIENTDVGKLLSLLIPFK